MQIGILKTGEPPAGLGAPVPSYPEMIRSVFGPGYISHDFDVTKGVLPAHQSPLDAYVITGSASGVHDAESWIAHLRDWLKALNPKIPLIGICFGHQIMAEAYGGAVERSSHGWAGGLREYQVKHCEPWMDEVSRFLLPIAHQDHVVLPPASSRVIAANAVCPFAALSYTERRALSFQAHPEFTRDYAALLTDFQLRQGSITASEAHRAKESLRLSNDCARVVSWIRAFLGGT
jgi:GMP synthase-like glutamine amidotransferase